MPWILLAVTEPVKWVPDKLGKNSAQRLLQVGNQVLRILQTD